MSSRDIVKSIIGLGPGPRCGFWMGNPYPDTWPILHSYFGTKTEEELRRKLGDDFRWISPQFLESTYRHPQDRKLFDMGGDKKSHGQAGPLADCVTVADVGKFHWPELEYLDIGETIAQLQGAGDFYRASGFWCPFFHDVMDLFGMEQYLIKMYTHPEVVQAVTERVCRAYLEANDLFYEAAGDMIDGFFFGNDFGTQLDLLLSPALFDEFVLPWFRKFTEQGHSRGYQVILHSCGSIYRVIERLLDSGVNCLHPLQAKAKNMEAERLAREFGGKVAFMGAIDTQRVLNCGTPAQVKDEVRRVKKLLGPHLIVSPSHEAILPDVPPQNVAAMAEAAHE